MSESINMKGPTGFAPRPINSTSARYTISFWERLFGHGTWIEMVNIRNAFIESQEEDLELLRKAVLDLQPEKVLEAEGKHLDEIGLLKARIGELETEILLHKSAEQRSKWKPEPMLSKPERAQALGRGRSYSEPNSGAHSTTGQVAGHTPDSGSLLLQTAVVAMVMSSDSDRTSGDTGRSSEICAPSPAPSEPARESYSAPEPTYSSSECSAPSGGD